MKTNHRLNLTLLGALALPILALAQTPDPRGSPSTPTVTTGLTTPAKVFTTFETASPAVQAAATSATAGAAQVSTSLADAIRQGIVVPATRAVPAGSTPTTTPGSSLTTAVAQATTAIVDEGRAARATSLTDREAALTRLRLAQTDTDRQRAISELRERSGQRLDDQRETARLVRDRIRQLRDNTTLIRPQ